MTGLDPDRDHIIEIATIVTNAELDVIGEGPVLAVHQPEAALATMDEWNTEQHGRSGLIDRVRQSEHDVTSAQRLTLQFVERYVPENVSPLCGNSICQDRRFLYRWMPALAEYFHYRNIDVSSVKELCRRWSPQVARGVNKSATHRALDDIRESIAELKYYREHFFKLD
jgi:oligoribonuclease